eukprot:scaffold902_cov242-Pinguiococcus_pyrenoidosus.AAC.2
MAILRQVPGEKRQSRRLRRRHHQGVQSGVRRYLTFPIDHVSRLRPYEVIEDGARVGKAQRRECASPSVAKDSLGVADAVGAQSATGGPEETEEEETLESVWMSRSFDYGRYQPFQQAAQSLCYRQLGLWSHVPEAVGLQDGERLGKVATVPREKQRALGLVRPALYPAVHDGLCADVTGVDVQDPQSRHRGRRGLFQRVGLEHQARRRQHLVVVHDAVQGLGPLGVNVTVQDDPLGAVGRHEGRLVAAHLAQQDAQAAVAPVARRRQVAVELGARDRRGAQGSADVHRRLLAMIQALRQRLADRGLATTRWPQKHHAVADVEESLKLQDALDEDLLALEPLIATYCGADR